MNNDKGKLNEITLGVRRSAPKNFISSNLFVGSSACLSEDGTHRYQLERIWDEAKPIVMFVMLNPSTADWKENDPTIRRCLGFAKRWGFGGLLVGNLFSFRSTNPKELLEQEKLIIWMNIQHLKEMSERSKLIVYAWGNSSIVKKLEKRFPDYKPLSEIVGEPHYIELCQDGTPKHPLYLRSDLSHHKYEVKNVQGVHDFATER